MLFWYYTGSQSLIDIYYECALQELLLHFNLGYSSIHLKILHLTYMGFCYIFSLNNIGLIYKYRYLSMYQSNQNRIYTFFSISWDLLTDCCNSHNLINVLNSAKKISRTYKCCASYVGLYVAQLFSAAMYRNINTMCNYQRNIKYFILALHWTSQWTFY